MRKIISFILVVTMLCSIFMLPAAAETDNRVWFEIKGNSRFFVESGDGIYENRLSYIDYLPGVDFAGFVAAPTGEVKTDQTAVINPGNGGGMFFYKLGEPSDTHSRWSTTVLTEVTENTAYWTINGVDYLLNLNENVIKVCKNAVDTSALTDSEKIKSYKSINQEAVIDVTDGRYKNIGLLAGIMSGKTRDATVTLVYSDEEVEKTITITAPTMTDAQKYSNGNIYLKNFTNSNDNSSGAHGFIPFTINTDATKTLTAIKIKDATTTTTTALCIYVLSAWGTKVTLAEVVAEIDAAIEKATTAKELKSIDVESVEKEFNCTLTAQKTALANKIAELNKAEALGIRPSTRIDIISTAVAPKEGYRQDFRNTLVGIDPKDTMGEYNTEKGVYKHGVDNTEARLFLNVYKLGSGGAYSTYSYPTVANVVANMEHLTDYEVSSTITGTGIRATLQKDGTYAKGTEAESYTASYYKVPGATGTYELGPVVNEDDNITTDIFNVYYSIKLGRMYKEDGTGTTNEHINTNVFDNINISGDYLNILMRTYEKEGDMTLIPVTIEYTTGDPETVYIITTEEKLKEEDRTKIVRAFPKKADGSEYTQQELVDAKTNYVSLDTAGMSKKGKTMEDLEYEHSWCKSRCKNRRLCIYRSCKWCKTDIH